MRAKLQTVLFASLFLLLAASNSRCSVASDQETKFFRIAGPAATSIIAFNPDGTLVWSNVLPRTNYSIQTCSSPDGGSNWVDYVQLPARANVSTNLLVAFNPPAGMALIPAGTFTIGMFLIISNVVQTNDPFYAAVFPTNVFVSGFYMDANLVSYGLWQSVYDYATNNGYSFDDSGSGKGTNYPVGALNWYDCVKWCNARSQQAGLTPVYYTDSDMTEIYTNEDTDAVYPNWVANGYRLPTEAEWEKAARGGLIGQRFPWGNTISENQANYQGDTNDLDFDLGPNGNNPIGMGGTTPVGYFAANGYGLTDMAGNAWEWCWDWWGTFPFTAGSPYLGGTDPRGAAGPMNHRVMRGGAWDWTAASAQSFDRFFHQPPTYLSGDIGFRCAKGF